MGANSMLLVSTGRSRLNARIFCETSPPASRVYICVLKRKPGISPKLLRVVQLGLEAHAVEVRSLFGGTGIAGMGGGSTTAAHYCQIEVIQGFLPNVPHEAEDALQKALDNHAVPAEINAAVARVRAARQQKQAEMTKAQSDLRPVLTPKQAAVLVARGMLD